MRLVRGAWAPWYQWHSLSGTGCAPLDIIRRLLSIVPGVFGAGGVHYLFMPWPGQSDKTSGKDQRSEIWERFIKMARSRLVSAHWWLCRCWYFQRLHSLIAGNKAHHLIARIFSSDHIRFLTLGRRRISITILVADIAIASSSICNVWIYLEINPPFKSGL